MRLESSKNKNIEPQGNFTGCYKKAVYWICILLYLDSIRNNITFSLLYLFQWASKQIFRIIFISFSFFFQNARLKTLYQQLYWGLFNNYVTLKLPFFWTTHPHHHASSQMITKPPLCYVTPDTDTPLYHLFLFFEVE